jgi:phasin family protein
MTTKTTRAANEAVDQGTDAAKDVTDKAARGANEAVDRGTDVAKDFTAKFGNFMTDGQRNLTENFEKLSKGLEGVASFQQDNVEAVVKSSEIAAKAFEGIGSEITAYSKKSFEDSVAAAQDFASAKTMTELFEKQTAFAQSAFEGWLHQTTKMNEIVAAAAKDITAPLGQRVSAASDAMKSFAL